MELERKIKRVPYRNLHNDKKHMVKISNEVFWNITNGHCFKVYCYLCSMYDPKFELATVTLKQIAEDTCIGRTTVRNSINWLEENGYIERIKIHEDNRNSYRIFH